MRASASPWARVAQGGPETLASNPPPFFGALNAAKRGVRVWKHIDHALLQFGA